MNNVVPDVYVDRMQISISPFGVSMTFSLTEPHPPTDGNAPKLLPQVCVRTSLQHAKVVAMVLRRQLKLLEEQTKTPILLPDNIFAVTHLAPEDW